MEKKKNVLKWFSSGMDLPFDQIPGKFLLELLGEGRILIENHNGVREYGTDRIGIKCEFGHVTIHGKELELCHMSKEKLVIKGRINRIAIHRRKCQ